MPNSALQDKIDDFLAQKRIAVAGVSRHASQHPVGNLIYQRLKTTGRDVFAVNPNMAAFEGDRCYPDVVAHDSMLERNWELVASRILQWLGSGPANVGRAPKQARRPCVIVKSRGTTLR